MKRLDLVLIVAALLIAFVTVAAVIVRAGGHDQPVNARASGSALPAAPALQSPSAALAS